MSRPRRLSDHQLIAARWEYEVTAISERQLALKFGVARNAISEWIAKQGWVKGEQRSYEGEAGQRQFERDVRAAIKSAYDRKIIRALEQRIMLPPVGKLSTLGQTVRLT